MGQRARNQSANSELTSAIRPSNTATSTSTGTFRLDSELLNTLKEEASQKRTSLNTLISQVLRSHIEYHTFASKGGMISMPKSLLMRLMEKIDEREVIQLSEHIAKNDLQDTITLMKGKYTPDSIMDFIESWTRVGGYPYRHHIEGGDNNNKDKNDKSKKKHMFVIQHDMGERWSLYFIELFRFAFEQAGNKIDFQHTGNTISFQTEF
jgi:hypothetical protein